MTDALREYGHRTNIVWVFEKFLFDERAAPRRRCFKRGVHAFDAQEFSSGRNEQAVNAVGFEDERAREGLEVFESERVGFHFLQICFGLRIRKITYRQKFFSGV